MFHCGLCNANSKEGENAHHAIVEQREAVYPFISEAHHFINREGMKIVRDDKGGKGLQIVKEILVCSACADTSQL